LGARVLVGDIRNQIDSIWNDFWAGGVSNPLSVIEQITYLLFIKRLDELQQLEEQKADTLKIPPERRIFPAGRDGRGGPELQKLGGELYENMRWSRFKGMEPREMFRIVDEHVFPFIRERLAPEGSLAKHMKDAASNPSRRSRASILDSAERRSRWGSFSRLGSGVWGVV
jgi:type I restriction enzyme M protein